MPAMPVDDHEQRTLVAMLEIYCRAKHDRVTRGDSELCDACQALLDYALARRARCVFLPNKKICARCPVHCYRSDMRQRVREVMRFSGPRMLLYHPLLTIAHLWQGLRHSCQR